MASEQHCPEAVSQFEHHANVLWKQRGGNVSDSTKVVEDSCGCCDCNICLECARDPMVTLCGHLYCWPCIYKWLSTRASPLDSSNKHQSCPVCKSTISISSLIPLYGRGKSVPELELKSPKTDVDIPSRPTSFGPVSHQNQQLPRNLLQPMAQSLHQQQPLPHYFGNYASLASSNMFSPTVGMFGEMVFAMMFRTSDERFYAYPYGTYQNFYPVRDNNSSSPRMRRQVMQVEKSLNRLTIFFFCCFVLCLLLF